MLELRWCAICRSDSEWEMPLCGDGHGAECPELMCLRCGTAVWCGPLPQPDGEPLVEIDMPVRAAS